MSSLVLRTVEACHALRVDGTTVIGRKDACDISVTHASVSGRHAEIYVSLENECCGNEDGSTYVITLRDLGSVNGTFVGKEQEQTNRLHADSVQVYVGDHIRFGFSPLVHLLERRSDAATTVQVQPSPSRSDQLAQAEASYISWLAQVQDEYSTLREQSKVAGDDNWAEFPSLDELQATCQSFHHRPQSHCSRNPVAHRNPNSPKKTSDPSICSPEVDIEAETERLIGRSWEVASVLRVPLITETDLQNLDPRLAESSLFISQALPQAAAALGINICGPVFQALLAKSARPTDGHIARARQGLANIETLDDARVHELVNSAEQLVNLLRIKVEDDGDLALARTVLEDSRQFLNDLSTCAKWRGVSTWQLFKECQDY